MSWKEVRPYVWPKLSATERSAMARSARHAFQELGIPANDSAWDHIRNPAETTSRKPQPPAFDSNGLDSERNIKVETPRRGISSQEMKGMQGTSRESSTAGRNQGGLSQKSGLKRADGDVPQIASTKSQNTRSSIQDDGSSLNGKPPAGDREGKNISSKVVRRHDKGPEPSDSEREGRHPQSDMEKPRAVKIEEGRRIDHRSSLSKRKTTDRDDSEYLGPKSLPQKRRKTEPAVPTRDEKPVASLTHKEPRTQTNTAAKDLPSLATTKRRKDSPSVPLKQEHHPKAKISSNMASSSHPLPSNDEGTRVRHGSTKIRRRSPIYTSSEDEELPVNNRVSSHSSSLATSSTLSNSHSSSNPGSRTTSRSLLSRSTTTDHTTLRERYSTSYVDYLTSLQKLVMQRRKVDQMLKTSDSGSVHSVTESDGEVELLNPEELARLAADHRKRHEELVSIQQMFTTSNK
jgi:RNA polymerase II elongation factor ELL